MSDLRKCQAAVVIGASVGAVEALSEILPALSHDFPFAVIVVVHVPADRESLLTALFTDLCELPVKEAEDKEPIHSGRIYFAPPNYHLLVEPDLSFSLSSDPLVHYSRPAIDVLFESAADAFGDAATGVILSGANADGADGLHAIVQAGGRAFVQAPRSAVGDTMPMAALAACPGAVSGTPKEIAGFLKNFTHAS
ncbi:MAG: chemotaxis protein CheB [Luteolibacter sp.]